MGNENSAHACRFLDERLEEMKELERKQHEEEWLIEHHEWS